MACGCASIGVWILDPTVDKADLERKVPVSLVSTGYIRNPWYTIGFGLRNCKEIYHASKVLYDCLISQKFVVQSLSGFTQFDKMITLLLGIPEPFRRLKITISNLVNPSEYVR